MDSQTVDMFYVVGPHLHFKHPFSVCETLHVPQVDVRHLLSPCPLLIEMSFQEWDLVSTNQVWHMRFQFERECHEEDSAMKSALW